jgi:hypothetical protein
MSEEQQGGFFSQIKNQIITTIGLIITAAGGLVVTNMEAIFGVAEEPQQIEAQAETPEAKKDTLVVIQKEQPKVIVKKVEPKKTETEKRKEEFDW